MYEHTLTNTRIHINICTYVYKYLYEGYNAERQKAYSDVLQALQVLFTMLSTLAAVIYSYMLQISKNFYICIFI